MNYKDNYIDYINKLKKSELIEIIDNFNLFNEIFKIEKIIIRNEKKDKIIEKIMALKEDYIKYIIMTLDLEDFNKLKELIFKKKDNEYLLNNREFINIY
ncbi:MAG: hypothetical protein ACLUFU_02100 [Bacilli bacterium]